MTLVQYLGTRRFRQRLLYLGPTLFKAFGKGWNDFYAWMLDFQDRRVTLDQILAVRNTTTKCRGLWDWERGEYYVDLMLRNGAEPTHTFLDIGCGYGRITIPLLKKIVGSGSYVGTEISRRRLALANEWIAREQLTDKNCKLICSKDNSLPFLANASVDIAMALSVFNHMPDKELDELLLGTARALKGGGLLFCYYLSDTDTIASVKTFRRSDADMEARLKCCGFETVRMLPDWDPDPKLKPDNSDSRMLLVRRSGDAVRA